MTDLFPPSEFDTWAAYYDRSIGEHTAFPFDGYSLLLQTIVDLADARPGAAVLDLGIGTGNLALLFYAKGCNIWGLDFSEKMLEQARKKLPNAVLRQVDVRAEWPPALQRRYDCIVSAYTFHHFTLDKKIKLVQHLVKEHLSPGGQIIIGDLAFQDAADEDGLRQSMGQDWEQEYYWLANEALTAFKAVDIPARFIKISSCAGIFQITPW